MSGTNIFKLNRKDIILQLNGKIKVIRDYSSRTLSPMVKKKKNYTYKFPLLKRNDYCFPLKNDNKNIETTQKFFKVKNKMIPLKIRSLIYEKQDKSFPFVLLRNNEYLISPKETKKLNKKNSFSFSLDTKTSFFQDIKKDIRNKKIKMRNVCFRPDNLPELNITFDENNFKEPYIKKEKKVSNMKRKSFYSHVKAEINKQKILLSLKKNSHNFDDEIIKDKSYQRIKLMNKKISKLLI